MKWNLLITLCIIHTFTKVYSEENVLSSTKLKQYVFANAPKEWFKYITKYLQVKLSRRYLNLEETYFFLKNKTLKTDDDKIFIREKTMVHPLGMVRRYKERSLSTSITYHNILHRRKVENKIIFILDEKLCLNLTFHHIHFGFRHLHTCSVGEVRVVSHSKNEQVFRYCGIHSNMINYPQNRHVSIFLPTVEWGKNKKTGIYNVTAFYSVIDTKMIVSLQRYRPL